MHNCIYSTFSDKNGKITLNYGLHNAYTFSDKNGKITLNYGLICYSVIKVVNKLRWTTV